MRVKLSRAIHFNSYEDGSVIKIIEKEYDGVPPIQGAVLADPAWDSKDEVKIVSISINTDDPNYYDVELTSKEVGFKDRVQSYVDMAEHHGWKSLY